MMVWKPLITGRLADQIADSVSQLAEFLARRDLPDLGPFLAEGLSGIALFFGYLHKVTGEPRFAVLAESRLEEAIDQLATTPLRSGLFTGISGVAWTNLHLHELLNGKADPDLNDDVDEALGDLVRSAPWRWDFDLVHGISGIACYALAHPDRSTARALLEPILERLGELAVRSAAGIAWRTSPAMMTPKLAERYPNGLFDLGMAHGVSGVIGMLGRVCGSGFQLPRARPLLDGAVEWLLANRRPDDGGSTFSRYAAPSPRRSCRSAWCYGDPGVAAALLGAARRAGEPSWEEQAIAVALKDCRRPAHETEVVDATLCHGAAGLGHLYNRLAQVTGEQQFADSARCWVEHALTLRRPDGVYMGLQRNVGEVPLSAGFLEGMAGIGLALLAAISDVEPGWDQPMLLGISPAQAGAPAG